jgi:exodeoxyribonuclease V beta subunit
VDGERQLTDILHLAELLQHASSLLDGEHALIRHLAEQRQEAARGARGGGDARQIRLESDADLVQVVTVHKAKGLEYPLVFLPFACSYRSVKPDDLPLKYHDENGCLQIALAATDDALARADRERLGEDLRKLYVALTRARHATWLGFAPLAELERSAFGYLLAGGEPIAPDALEQYLQRLHGSGDEDCAQIVVAPAPAATVTGERLRRAAGAGAAASARLPLRAVRENWWVASYSSLTAPSALTAPGAARANVAETPAEDVFVESLAAGVRVASADSDDADDAIAPAALATPVDTASLHDFPRGAEVGSFLHELLEWAAAQGFAQVVALPQAAAELIARRCRQRGWQRWIDPLCAWFQHFLALSLPLPLPAADGVAATSFSFAGLAGYLAEMEFWLAATTVDIGELDRLVCAHTLGGAARPPLSPGQLNGMLKGFIDLVFEVDGRYYVADYKSNWLGADDGAYTPAAMRGEILHSRYELQYVLYLFALHRLLKARLPDYDYDRHVGGAVYLFLRGIAAPARGVFAERPPRALIEKLDSLFAGSATNARVAT